MPEVEDERSVAENGAQFLDGLRQGRPADNQQDRIEIALDGKTRLQPIPGKPRRHGGIETGRVDPGFRRVTFMEKPRPSRNEASSSWQNSNALALMRAVGLRV